MSQKSSNQGLFLLFLLDDKKIRIRFREAQKLTDRMDPEHC
jgi:hypothetical protein